jgi:carboxypeptidase C (cathepsin A)
MNSLRHSLASIAIAIGISCNAVLAADAPPAAAAPTVPPARTVVTHHTARIGNRSVSYTATAGTILLTDKKDEPTASVFYVAYTADGMGPTARRPITFAYNGGPGGSSALIHLGAFGPRTVVTTNAATTPPPPGEIVDNPDSLLDTSDLVFVDAVGTGYSRIVGNGTPKGFYGVEADGEAFEQFVRRYITINDRWNSPKYLAGESYGTLRSVVLAKMLQGAGISLTGVTLISTVLDFSTLITQPGNDLPYWLFLPSETAVAAYHHKITVTTDLPTLLARVRTFAQGPFASALAKGAALSASERAAIAGELHADTGLPLDYLVRSNVRVEPERFEKELLSDRNETVGRYDGRFEAYDLDPISDSADTDPSSDAVFGAFTAGFNRYIRDELHYRTDANYVFLSGDVNRQWQWHHGDGGSPAAVNVIGDLRDVMTANPYLRIYSANGIYDLATPFFATEYSLAHSGLDPALQAHITYGYYPSGHMIYLNPVAHAALKADLARFYTAVNAR